MPVSAAHTFLAGVDTDTGDARLAPNAARAMLNVAVERGYVTNAWGNEALPIDLPAGRCKTVGSFPDTDTGIEIFFVWNSAGHHRLYRYTPDTQTSALLLEWAGLNLREDHYVTGGGIIADQLGYLDADGVPRLLSLKRAAAGEYTPALLAADPHALDLARRVPMLVLSATRMRNEVDSDSRSKLNLTAGRAWQFAYLYGYRDSERSTLSPFTEVLPVFSLKNVADYNDPGLPIVKPDNFIRITIPNEEPISPLVDYIELYARRDDSTAWRLVNTIRHAKNQPIGRAFDFYGNTLGISLSEAESIKQREAVPMRAGAMTAAQNRFMLADITEGYAAPESIGLQLSFVNHTTDSIVTDVLYIQNAIGPPFNFFFYQLPNGLYQRLASPLPDNLYPLPPYQLYLPTPAQAPLTYQQVISNALPGADYNKILPQEQVQLTFYPYNETPTFYGGGTYTVAIQFYDHAGRTCGAAATKTFTVPPQPLSLTSPVGPNAPNNATGTYVQEKHRREVRRVAWNLVTTDWQQRNAEIPDWAESYQLVLTEEQSRSFLLQFKAADMLIYLGEVDHSALVPTPDLQHMYKVNNGNIPNQLIANLKPGYSVFVDIGNLPASPYHMGYAFKAGSGDRIKLLEEGYDLEIQRQVGDYLEVFWPTAQAVAKPYQEIEIYSPTALTDETPLFENGPRYPVTRAVINGQEQRSYSTTSGFLVEDCFLIQRQIYGIYQPSGQGVTYDGNGDIFLDNSPAYRLAAPVVKKYTGLTSAHYALAPVEAISSTDRHYSRWLHGRTRPTAARLEGQADRGATLRFTGPLIPGTHVNGLTTMDALNEKNLAREQGRVKSLKLAAQTQAEGTVLLAIQERGSESFYLGQAQLAQAAGQALLAISDQVLSPGNPLSGALGTAHPESVRSFGGRVWYYDELRCEMVRYDRNGTLGLAAQHKFQNRMRELATRHRGERVVGYYDPKREEYLLTFQGSGDMQPETVAFSEKLLGFADRYAFTPEWGMPSGGQLLTFVGGTPHLHARELPRNTFYGVRSVSQLTLVAGGESHAVEKTWTGVNQEAAPLWLPLVLRNAAGQVSRMLPGWFTRNRTLWQGSIRRDQNTPGLGSAQALHEGHKMSSPMLEVVLECDTNEPATLQHISFNYAQNPGLPIAPTR